MLDESASPSLDNPSHFKNWLSLTGAVTATGGLFAFVFLVAIDTFAHETNPYVGILTYLVAPAFLILGLALVFAGWWVQRRQAARHPVDGGAHRLAIDLSRPGHRRYLAIFGSATLLFLLLTAFGSYQTYHFTESVTFCGQTCHGVMQPEFTTYQHGSHARVSCAECHIGSGASWYVKSKISGTYQVYATTFHKYDRPIKTPIRNLRPAQETCEHCHWPEKFTGNLDRTYVHYLSDKKNTPYTVRLSLRVGGGQTGVGFFGGIHWHMNVASRVEYFASDPQRQTIPWVRITSTATGEVRVFRAKDFQGDPPAGSIRVMDCMDCHNRPAHAYQTANQAVETGLALGQISTRLPYIKQTAVEALTREYATTADAMEGIAVTLRKKYPGRWTTRPRPSPPSSESIRRTSSREMKADWRSYPSDIGHKDWPGCFRCHDDKHRTADGQVAIRASDCTACHTILAQGRDDELARLAPQGMEFKHPGGDLDPDVLCSDCHNGGLQGK